MIQGIGPNKIRWRNNTNNNNNMRNESTERSKIVKMLKLVKVLYVTKARADAKLGRELERST